MRTFYRLVYKNGNHSAWDDDIERIREYAEFFEAKIESCDFGILRDIQKESKEVNS